MQTVDILGVSFHALTVEETLCVLESYLYTDKNHTVVTPNPEGVMQSRRNPSFQAALNGADLRLADGIGITLAARILKMPLPERVRGVDITFAFIERMAGKFSVTYESASQTGNLLMAHALAEKPKQQRITAYFLGGAPGIAEAAKSEMQSRYPALIVLGTHHGFFSAEDEPHIIAEINRLSPDILLVCMGMPRAELWAAKNRDIDTRITLCVGGTIDIMAGNVKLAPSFLRKIGLEWLYRLVKQPSRIMRMLDIPRFVLAVLFSKR